MRRDVGDRTSGLELGEDGHRLTPQGFRDVGQLLAQDGPNGPTGTGQKHQAADGLVPAGRGDQGDHRPLAVPDQPCARLAGQPGGLDGPGAGVVRVVGETQVGFDQSGTRAFGDAAFVGPHGGDSLFGQTFGEPAIAGSGDAERVVAVPVGGAGTGDDQGRGPGRPYRRQQGPVQGRRFRWQCDRGGDRICQQGRGEDEAEHGRSPYVGLALRKAGGGH